jgi:cellobiose-specific phosphotransferase system component IIA
MGVIALRNNNLDAAAEYFALSGNASSVKNAAVIDILDGEYEAAVAKLAGSNECNAILAQILVGNYSNVDKLTCKCAKSYYVRAIAAARQGNAEGVKANLEKACKNEKLAERAAKDVEFAQYR